MFFIKKITGFKLKRLTILCIFFFAVLMQLSCASGKSSAVSGSADSASYKSDKYESRALNEKIKVNAFITTPGNPSVAVYKYKIEPGAVDEWGDVIFSGFEAAAEAADKESVLAVGVIFTDGKSEGYFVSYRDYMDFKHQKISDQQFINKIRKKKLPAE